MREFPGTPKEMVASIWRNRGLILASSKRDIQSRYRGSMLGALWSFINPLFMLTVYTFVFSEVFKAKWSVESDSKVEFALVLFIGLILFNFFSECVSRSPVLIVTNPNYVKKVVFPLEILPLVNLLSAGYHAAISIVVWLIAHLTFLGLPPPTLLTLPLLLIPFAMLIMGLSWFLASLGVFLRDISQLVGVTLTMLMFLSPIFYPASALPQGYQRLLYLNPLTPTIEMAREVLFWGRLPDIQVLAAIWFTSLLVAFSGFAWFQQTRKGFSDVL